MKHKTVKSPRVGLIDRLELLGFRGRDIQGIRVGGLDKASPAWHAIEEALLLIKQYDSLRYRRILADLDRVWIRILPGVQGRFNAALKACELDDRFVLAEASRPDIIAATIVHEATHARLWNCGIGYDEPIRARVEAACFKRERAFAARLPNGQRIREQAEAKLSYYTAETWTDAAMNVSYEEGAAQALREMGQPEWLIRVTFRFNAIWRRAVRLFIRGGSNPGARK